MTAFPEDRVLGQIVDVLQRLGGLATMEEIKSQMTRSGAVRMPPETLDVIVRLTIRANQDGRGLGCFTEMNPGSVGLTSGRPTPGGWVPPPNPLHRPSAPFESP